MKKIVVISILALAFAFAGFTGMANADSASIEVGPGIIHSSGSVILLAHYTMDTRKILVPTFINFTGGGWTGHNANGIFAITVGLKPTLFKSVYATLEFGPAAITNTQGENLKTYWQFLSVGGIGMPITKKLDIMVKFTHVSNGHGLFHWAKQSCAGENFPTLQLSYRF
jgi:hypothetical protein